MGLSGLRPSPDWTCISNHVYSGTRGVCCRHSDRPQISIAEESDERLEAFRKAAATVACTFLRSYIYIYNFLHAILLFARASCMTYIIVGALPTKW